MDDKVVIASRVALEMQAGELVNLGIGLPTMVANYLPPGVEVLGLVPVPELASLYRRTACLVFPSLYEGFGQPPLEAMASGAPVAASNIPALAEVAGEAAALFDPSEPEDIAAVVSAVLDAPDRFAARTWTMPASVIRQSSSGTTPNASVNW